MRVRRARYWGVRRAHKDVRRTWYWGSIGHTEGSVGYGTEGQYGTIVFLMQSCIGKLLWHSYLF